MAKEKATLVTGLFKSKVAAEAAVDAVMKRGFTRDDISVLMSDATRSKEFALQTRTHAADGLGIGSAIGGTVGAVIAAIAAVGTTLFQIGRASCRERVEVAVRGGLSEKDGGGRDGVASPRRDG